jgi:division/cell wall cluster transcriptional repressor MraZ
VNNFERKLDDKKRLTIPVEVRGEFGGGYVVLTKGYDNTLALYSQKYWEEVIEPALEGDFRDVESFRLNRQIQSGQSRMHMDAKQGRVTIEQRFLDYAGINKAVNAFRVKTAAGRSYWAIEAA